MAAYTDTIVAQNSTRDASHSVVLRSLRLLLVLAILLTGFGLRARRALGLTDAVAFYDLVQSGQGNEALALLADEALAIGGWAAAPGDTIVYAPDLAWNVRGAVRVIDLPPVECADQRTNRFIDECHIDFTAYEDQVRFGPATFSDPLDEGRNPVPRPTFDDILSTYIEEVGHSWQEYLYETNGLGSGPRTRQTGYYTACDFAPGSEYQVKLYILNLDGTLINLSAEERGRFVDAICEADGYANPVGRAAPAYGAPHGWPNPDGWPTTSPTAEAHTALCVALRG